MTYNDEGLYKSYLVDTIALMEDCDIDCQQKGSQMTLVAILNQVSFAIIALNAVIMFLGTWMYRARVMSVYCTFFACLFQFAIIVTSGVILCSPYAIVCARSMQDTAGDLMWTMRDDYGAMFSLWIISIIAMFPFVCCGLIPTMKCDDKVVSLR